MIKINDYKKKEIVRNFSELLLWDNISNILSVRLYIYINFFGIYSPYILH